MNKTLIAIAISTVTLTNISYAAEESQAGINQDSFIYSASGSSLEVGGRAEARLSIKDGKAEDQSRIRLNFLGKTEINESLYGVGFYEGEFITNDKGGATDSDSDSITNRYAYAGIGGTFGEVTYGKNDGALGVLTDFTDIMSYHGNSAADKINVADRADNMLSYKGSFSDLSVKASYRFADRSEGSEGYTDNGQDGYSLSAIYSPKSSGFALGAGFAEQDQNNEYMLATSYSLDSLYLAATFTDGEKDFDSPQYSSANFTGIQDYKGYELAASYKLNQLVFSTTYNNAETGKDTSVDNLAFDATYYFKPNFRSYVSYNVNLLDENDRLGTSTVGAIGAEDEVALGLRYDF